MQQQRKSAPAAAVSSLSLTLGRSHKMQKMPVRANSSDSQSSTSSSSHSTKCPSPDTLRQQRDQFSTQALQDYLDLYYPLESTPMHAIKQEVLVSLKTICEDWANDLLIARKVKFTNIEIFVYGSFRLGVSQDSDDIDASLVVPRGISRGDFFSENGPPQSLLQRLRKECEVVLAIQTAYIPLLKLIWRGVQVDLVLATLLTDVVPHSVWDGDAILQGLDPKSQLSLSGPRVTEKLLALVGDANLSRFRLVLRALRHWAKVRSIYNNKFGFFGGINFAILATFTCQLYPQVHPNKLVLRAINLVAEWSWPKPMQVCHVVNATMTATDTYVSHRDLMPIITPAHPNTNSALGVTAVTRAILLQEFKKSCTNGAKQGGGGTAIVVDNWGEFFQPPPQDLFFARFSTFVVVSARLQSSTSDRAKSMAWTLFVESRIRKFCDQLERYFACVFPYQVGLPTAATEDDGGMCWIIGIECNNNEVVVLPSGVVDLFIETCMREARDPERSLVRVNVMQSKQLRHFV